MIPLLLTLAPFVPQDDPDDDRGGFPGLPANHEPRVEIAWNRLYDLAELYAHMDRLAEAYPQLVEMRVLGRSIENRELRLYVLNDPSTGEHDTKPAMWIDGNVHGNEVQAGEAVAYVAWYLLENHGHNERVTELLERCSFYLVPSVNPDGRARWFAEGHTASSSRTGYQPVDDDRDGVADEDPPNDLDGDGHITTMRKYVPGEGTHRVDPDDPRRMERVPVDERGLSGDWVILGREGIDDDGDGRVNEDGLGGYDMNRAWPSYWQPGHVQRGAGAYPLFWPETRAVAEFVRAHPNIAAVQSFHNAGGMILRGPGVEVFGSYPRADVRVYDALAEEGELMLPFYRSMVIWKDLYSVFGGFATWTYEGLGIISFTNELWTRRRSFPQDGREGDRYWFDEHLLSGAGFVDWHPYEHPFHGTIEIGGFKKDVGRVPPSFLVEEMLHRNAMFCLAHAEACPQVEIDAPVLNRVAGDTWTVDVRLVNRRRIPTRTARAIEKGIGQPDVVLLEGKGVRVLASGVRGDRFRPEVIDLTEQQHLRILLRDGVPSLGEVRLRWFVRGQGQFRIRYRSQKAGTVIRRAELE